jgi:hypothetical protein
MFPLTYKNLYRMTSDNSKQEGHDGPEVAHLYIASHPTPAGPILTQGLLFEQTW